MSSLRPRLVGAAVLAALAVAACSPADDGPAPTVTSVASDAPVGEPAPITPAPARSGWSSLVLGPVTLDVPEGFATVQEPPDADARTAVWVAAHGEQDGARAAVSVARDTAPQRDAAGTAGAALQAERAQRGAQDAADHPVPWPGTDAAHHLTYVQDVAVGGTVVPHRAEWVYADLPDGTQLAIGVVAPLDLFDTLALHDALATWRTTP